MSNKRILLLVLLTSVLISGCIFDKDGTGKQINESKFIPQKDLPAGFTFMAIHETSVDIGNSSINAIEGVYRNNKGEDMYVQALENNTPSALVNEYKLMYKDANYDPFEEIFVNGHKATKVKDYNTINGQRTLHYTIIWATEKYMMLVGASTDAESVMNLASATGI